MPALGESIEQLAFADVLSFNPWHAMPEHRPLGNQGRARKIIYTQFGHAGSDLVVMKVNGKRKHVILGGRRGPNKADWGTHP